MAFKKKEKIDTSNSSYQIFTKSLFNKKVHSLYEINSFNDLLLIIDNKAQAKDNINYAARKKCVSKNKALNINRLTDETLFTGSVLSDKGEQIFELDLSAEFKIGGVHLYFDEHAFPYRIEIQAWLKEQWKSLSSVSNNKHHSISIPFQETVNATSVRMICQSQNGFKTKEITVWGEHVPKLWVGEGK